MSAADHAVAAGTVGRGSGSGNADLPLLARAALHGLLRAAHGVQVLAQLLDVLCGRARARRRRW